MVWGIQALKWVKRSECETYLNWFFNIAIKLLLNHHHYIILTRSSMLFLENLTSFSSSSATLLVDLFHTTFIEGWLHFTTSHRFGLIVILISCRGSSILKQIKITLHPISNWVKHWNVILEFYTYISTFWSRFSRCSLSPVIIRINWFWCINYICWIIL